MDLNKAMIIGRLTRDPEVRTTPQGQTVASFGLATNRVWTNQSGQKQEKVEYHNIVAWRRLAEICGQYLSKGRRVYIEGHLQTRDWVGQDGVKKYRTEIIADNMIMLDGRGGSPVNTSASNPPREEESPAASEASGGDSSASSESSEEEIKVEDIPF